MNLPKILSCFFMGALFLLTPIVSQAAILKFATEEDFPPYSFMEKSQMKGIDVEIFFAIMKRMKVSTQLELLPWKRVTEFAKVGQVDGAFAFFHTEERAKFLHYLSPAHFSRFHVFVKKGDEFSFTSIEDLYNKRIGIPLGYSISDKFDAARKKDKFIVVEFRNLDAGFRKLYGRDIHALVNNTDKTRWGLKYFKYGHEITYLPVPVNEARPAHFVLSKKSKQIKDLAAFAKQFEQHYNAVQEEGLIEQLFEKYLN